MLLGRKVATHFTPTPVVVFPRRRVGLNGVIPTPEMIALAKSLGVTRVRDTLYWKNYLDDRFFTEDEVPVPEGTPGSHTIATWWAIHVARYLAAGLDLLVVVHTPPTGMTLAQGIAAMPSFVAARAAQFPGLSWQIMNEMDANVVNGDWFNVASANQNTIGQNYGALLSPVYDAIKAADSTAKVIVGGIAYEPTAFYAGLAAVAAGKFDAIAVHVYRDPSDALTVDGKPGLTVPFNAKSVALRAVLGSIPLWCTETGFHYDNPSIEEQARQIGAILDENDRNARYDRLYLYAMQDETEKYGVVSPAGARRHAAMLLTERVAV